LKSDYFLFLVFYRVSKWNPENPQFFLKIGTNFHTPNPDKPEITNFKHQITNKYQIPIFNDQIITIKDLRHFDFSRIDDRIFLQDHI
jgi:hypothetical protein